MMLVLPWPTRFWPVWLILLIFGTIACIRSQSRIARTKGQLTLLKSGTVYWQDQKWIIRRVPLLLSFGIFLSLKSMKNGKNQHLWLAIDSMAPDEWRCIRNALSQYDKNRLAVK